MSGTKQFICLRPLKMTANTRQSEEIGVTESFGPFGLIRPPPSQNVDTLPASRETVLDRPENIRERWIHEKRNSGQKTNIHVSKGILFFCQVILIYAVVIASIVNLALEPTGKNRDLWSALLFSSIGYLLPSPTLKSSKPKPSSLPVST